jgi:hypothetical protein
MANVCIPHLLLDIVGTVGIQRKFCYFLDFFVSFYLASCYFLSRIVLLKNWGKSAKRKLKKVRQVIKKERRGWPSALDVGHDARLRLDMKLSFCLKIKIFS